MVRFAIAAGVGIYTGYTAVPALIKAELAKAAVIRGAIWKGIVAATDAYTKTGRVSGYLGRSTSQTDSSLVRAGASGSSFTNKNGSQHVPSYPTTGLGYYGLEAGQPDKDGNYNPEDAVWVLMNAINSTGGFKNKPPKNWPLIYHEATRGFENGLLGTLFLSYSTGNLKKFPRGSLYSSLFFALFDALTAGKNEYEKQDSIPNNKQYRIPGIPPLNETE